MYRRILVADDERDLAQALEAMLKREHYSVDVVYDGQDALDYGLAENYDCLVLDIMMPGRDGLDVLRRLREKGVPTPVLLLTAKGEVNDRIRALTRRSGAFTPDQLTVGDVTLDRTTFELSANGSSVRLGNREYQLLELLMRQQGRFLSTEELMERIWGYESEAELNVVWAYISYLRRKLEGLHANVRIAASRGRGYMLEVGT